MATFIEEAQALLTAEKFSRLELLRMKSSNFESTNEEEIEFSKLKNEVRTAINNRDKDKNLQFIADPLISLVDIFRVKNVSKEQVVKATKEYFPTPEVATEVIASIPYKDKKGKDAIANVKMGSGDAVRLDREASKTIKTGNVKPFVKALTEFGKTWIAKSHEAVAGPVKGTVYDNIPAVALRFGFKKEELIKELIASGIIVIKK